MPKPDELIRNILSDMKVELTEMFDRNFERKGFFGSKWKPRKNKKAKGSLLHVTGKMRRSIRAYALMKTAQAGLRSAEGPHLQVIRCTQMYLR